MLASGWRAAVRDHQRHFVYEYYPENDPVQWEILKVASAELAKLEALLAGKMSRAVEDKRQEVEARRQAVLNALEDDKERRRLRFSYGSSSGASGSGGGA